MAQTIAWSGPRILAPVLLALMPCGAATAARGEVLSVRSDLPISEVTLEGGARLYSVSIKVGATEIEAGLDTGSTGLRILPGTLAPDDARAAGGISDNSFSSGVQFEGSAARGTLAIGAMTGPVKLETVTALKCSSERPACPATNISPSDYGKRGGLTSGRFRAILGINFAETDLSNPLIQLGVKQWIVELPRVGEAGHLILNPSNDDLKNFARVPTVPALRNQGGLRDAVQGCIINSQKVADCGVLLMDSGAPNIRLVNGKLKKDSLADGAAAAFAFYNSGHLAAVENIMVGHPETGTALRVERNDRMKFTTLFAGTVPYLAFDVLYDTQANEIGLRARPQNAAAPLGIIPKE